VRERIVIIFGFLKLKSHLELARVRWAAYRDKANKGGASTSHSSNIQNEDMDKSPVHFSFISHQVWVFQIAQ